MKKLLALALVVASFTACNDASKTSETTKDTSMVKKTDTVPVVTTTTTTTTVDTLNKMEGSKMDAKKDTIKK